MADISDHFRTNTSPPARQDAMPVSRVALLSDDARLTAALRRGLRALGISAKVVGHDTMSALSGVDLVIVDARTPEILTAYLATTPTMATLIAVVPPGDQAQASRALAAGARALLSAPIRVEVLRLALHTAWAGKQVGETLTRQSRREAWLREATQDMWHCETTAELIPLIGRQIRQGLGYDRVRIWLVDEAAGTIIRGLCLPEEPQGATTYSTAADSSIWDSRLLRVLLRDKRLYSYSAHFQEEIPETLRRRVRPAIGEHLAAALRLNNAVLGWISVDNTPSGRHIGPEHAPELTAYAYEAAAALDKTRLHQAATRRAQELAALVEVSIAVAAQRDPKAVCGVAMEQLVSRFGYEFVNAYLRDDRGLVMQAQFGYEQSFETIAEQGVIGRTMRLGVPQFVADVRLDPDYVSAGKDIVAEVCVPILIGNEAKGVINVESPRPGELDLQTQELLILLARQIAITVERGNLLEEERRRANQAEALTRATAVIAFNLDVGDIYQQVLSLLGTVVRFDTASVFKIEGGIASSIVGHDREQDRFFGTGIQFPAAEDPIFGPWLQGEPPGPVLILDTQRDPRWANLASKNAEYIGMGRTYMAIPLIVEGELVGALTLTSFRPHAFDEMTVAATLEFAERLTRALRNARVYELERAANTRLQSIMRVQDDFVATVSHELRTPLTSILGFSENLLDHWDRFDDAHRQVSVVKIQRAGKRLHRLVRDLLQISRLEAGTTRVHAGPLHLLPIIRQAVEELSLEFDGQVVHIGAGMEDAMLWSDGDRLRQVIGNLLDNAAKYSAHGAPISISWATEHPWGVLGVHDHGPGIQADDLPRLFQRFSKLHSVARAGHTGTGLGLYICKQVIESLGGTIWYECGEQDRPEGRSAFHIRLPLTEMWGPELA